MELNNQERAILEILKSRQSTPAPQMGSQQVSQPIKKKKGNFLTDLIPTATSILGGLAGSFPAPGVGTAAGGVAGGLLGTKLRNMLTGEEDKAEDYLTEGAFGALGGIGKAGRAVGAATGAIKGGEGAGRAAQILRTGAPEGYQGFVSKGLTKLSDKTAGQSIGASPSQFTNFQKSTGQDLTDFMRQNKLVGKSPDQVRQQLLDPLNQKFSDTVSGIGRPISADEILNATTARTAPLRASNVPENRALAGTLEDRMLALVGKGDFTPSAIGKTRAEYDALSSAYKKSGVDPAKMDESKRAADILRDVLQGADVTGTLKQTGRDISKVRTYLDDVLTPASNKGRGAQPAGLTALLSGGFGAGGFGVGGPLGGLGGAALGFGLTKAANNPKVLAGTSKAADALARRATATGATTPMQTAKTMATTQVPARMLTGNIPLGGEDAQAMVEQPTDSMAMADTPGNTGGLDQGTLTALMSATQEPASQYPLENAMQDIQKDLSTTGGENLDTIMKVYQFANPESNGKSSKASIKQQEAATKMANAQTILDTLMGQYEQSGGGQGRVGGFLSSIMGSLGLNEPLSVYNRQSAGSIPMLARAMGEVGPLTDQDRSAYLQMIPKATDTKDEAAMKLQNIMAILEGSKQNAMSGYSGGSAEDILSALGYQ